MAHRWGRTSAPLFAIVVTAFACGGKPQVSESEDGDDGVSQGGAGAKGGTGGGPVIDLPGDGGVGGSGNTGGMAPVGCGGVTCGPGQRCDLSGSAPECVDKTCDELECDELEECQPASGGGVVCRSIACDSDVDCALSRHCDGEKCVDDACEAESRRCQGDEVLVCSANGAEQAPAYTCKSAGYFESECSDASVSASGCTCEGDWDCPEYTVCETGVCKGTGVAPTCTLPPTPFEDVLPAREFRWGGTKSAQTSLDPNRFDAESPDDDATGKAFAWSAQVGSTPIVVNLDDDNGDGFVNELDFPEILFISYHNQTPDSNGVVRALHGGGPRKGEDYFALCGDEHWFEGDPVATDCAPGASGAAPHRDAANARASGALAAGDLDGDGVPEIVYTLENGAVRILDNRGAILTTSASGVLPSGDWRYPMPALANLDWQGLPEIVIGNRVFTLGQDAGKLVFDRVLAGTGTTGTMHHNDDELHHGPTVCLADLTTEHDGLEIVAGTTAYRLPDVVDCADSANDGADYCEDRLTVLWSGTVQNPSASFYAEGFCAVADVLGEDTTAPPGPDNRLDQVPEVLVIADGELLIFEAATGALLDQRALGGGISGGAPNVDDFDGDGFPEVATALADFYTVVDLQAPVAGTCPAWTSELRQNQPSPDRNPARDPGGACTADADCNEGAVCNVRAGSCVCLHSSWRRETEDDSSRVTSSSIFDFNGDGAAEVVYNDECYFRVYDGATGGVYLAIPSLSRTTVENPVVADVDNDGNAEIVFVQNNEEQRCSELNLDSWPDGTDDVPRSSLPNGLEVWGDPSDVWVAARRVWNQHAYHVTNVTEGGAIPLHEPESWRPLNGRLYNTYRAQPRNYGVAPDLSLVGIQITSPDVSCGELTDRIQISVLVKNEGDLRVGPGVVVDFTGVFEGPDENAPLVDASGAPLRVTLDKSLEPGASTIVTVEYEAGSGGRDDLPVEVRAIIDAEDGERECDEDDNEITGPVEASDDLADLSVTLTDATCRRVRATVRNDGALPAESIVVRIYAGDPSQGGIVLAERTIAGPLEPGDSEELSVNLDPLNRDLTLYVVVDPENAIEECNDANNSASETLSCVIAR